MGTRGSGRAIRQRYESEGENKVLWIVRGTGCQALPRRSTVVPRRTHVHEPSRSVLPMR